MGGGVSVLYLDTARLGQACPRAFQAQLDASRLSADDPSMYSERFLREGSSAWSQVQLSRYPAFESWEGVDSFKTRIADHFGVNSGQSVFLANRSAQLVRIAARLMFRTCRNVLTCDLNWPHWQAIVGDEAARSGQQVTVASALDAVLDHRLSANELAGRLEAAFLKRECDAVFLPAINNLGIRLPLSKLLSTLKASGRLRFSIIDAAQSFCHLPQPSPVMLADVTITGGHKWLRSSLPLGIVVCRQSLVAEQIRTVLKSFASSSDVDDPLLRFTEQICNRSVDHFAETVGLAPLFSANAAIRSSRSRRSALRKQISRQFSNMNSIERAAAGTWWSVVETDTSVRSGILLMRSTSPMIQDLRCDWVQARFRKYGIALSSYPRGLIRISAPTETVCEVSMERLAAAFARVP